MKYLLCFFIVSGLAGCQTPIKQPRNNNVETVSPRDYQACINTLKSGDDEDSVIRCQRITNEIRKN